MSRAQVRTKVAGVLRRSRVRPASGPSVMRTQTGLIYSDDFGDLSGWSLGTGWTHRDESSFVSFGHFPREFFTNSGVGSADQDGVREGQLYIEDDVWWLLYDAGNGVTGWRQFLASSTDHGVTWTKHGQILGLTNGAGGSWAAVATGWLEKRGSTYYLHRVTTNVVLTGSLAGLPNGPYHWDTWSATDLLGTWTWVSNTAVPAGAAWAASEFLPCSVVKDGSTYYAFAQGGTSSVIYAAGYATGPSPTGPWTTQSTSQFSAAWFAESRYPENVKVFYHPGLDKWVTIGNVIATSRALTDRNFIAIGDSVSDWSAAQREYSQNIFPIDTDVPAVGVQTHLTGPDGELLHDVDTGNVPVIYDASATSGGSGYHLGRKLYASELEVSPGAAQFDSDTASAFSMSRALDHTDVEIEFAVKYHSNTSGSSMQFWFRCNSAMTNGYRLVVRNLGTLLLQKIVGGVVTTVYSNPGGSQYYAEGPLMVHRLRFKMVGNTFQAWQDGQEHIAPIVDTSHSSGTHIALAGYAAHAEVRKLSIRTGVANVVVSGLASTADVVLRSIGGLPVARVSAVAGVATFTTLTHGPYGSFVIDGVEYSAPDGIWPGDSFQVA